MDFSRLKSSASLSSAEEPSIYLTLCMIESLFKDVEESASCDLSNLPLGDESVSTKLVWLSRKLLKVYKENNEEFSRNRARLDEMMQQMQAGESALAQSAQVSERLQQLQEKKSNLLKSLEIARREQERYVALQKEVSGLENDLKDLRSFNADAVQAQIISLREQCDALSRQRQTAEAAHASLLTENASLHLALEQAEASMVAAQDERRQLQEKLTIAQNETAECKADFDAEQQSYFALIAEKEKCYAELGCLSNQKLRAQQQIEQFRSQELLPLETSVQEVLRQVDARKQEFSEKQAILEQYEKEHDAIILSLAVLLPKLEYAEAALNEKRDELCAAEHKRAVAEDERNSVEGEIKELTQQLGALQDDILRLRDETLPRTRSHTEAALVSLRTVQDEIAGYETQTADLTKKCDDLREKLPPLTQTVNQKNTEYSELTARYSEQSKELARLQQQLEALRGKNDKEKLRRYKEQLNTDIAELNTLSEQCSAVEAELRSIEKQLRQKEDNLTALQEQQKLLHDLENSVDSRLKELSTAAAKENLQQISLLQIKLQKMGCASRKLADAQALISKTLNIPSLQNASNLSHQIQMVGASLTELQKALLSCADCIRLEETE